MKVARSELMFSTPTLAKFAVSAANIADSRAHATQGATGRLVMALVTSHIEPVGRNRRSRIAPTDPCNGAIRCAIAPYHRSGSRHGLMQRHHNRVVRCRPRHGATSMTAQIHELLLLDGE